tara:strand:- start:4359 stop:5741 length:1383 start_codon:yes stop_codon:yes gene_type:complete
MRIWQRDAACGNQRFWWLVRFLKKNSQFHTPGSNPLVKAESKEGNLTMKRTKTIFNSALAASIAALAASLSACGGGSSAALQVTESETTVTNGSTTTVERRVFEYDGSHLTGVRYFINGEQAGRRELSYTGKHLSEMVIFDVDGDRATETWTYTDGRLERQLFSVPQDYTNDIKIEYDKNDFPKEVVQTFTSTGSSTSNTTYTRFDYDGDLLSDLTNIQGSETGTMELDYDESDRLDRAIRYQDGRHIETLEYVYDDDTGQLSEFADEDNNRTSVSYDDSGRISRIQRVSASGRIESTRYEYGTGSLSGLSIAPAMSPFFNLKGDSKALWNPEHLSFELPGDFPTPTGGGGGGEGGGGEGGGGEGGGGEGGGGEGGGNELATCGDFQAESLCEDCTFSYCCESLLYCADNQSCVDYNSCIQTCTDQDCYDYCAAMDPTGSNLLSNYWDCSENYCSAACGI